MSVAVVTGGSSGIGLHAARELVRNGYRVYELSRRDMQEAGVTHLTCDVTSEEQVRAAIAQVEAAEKSIDLLLLCAGYGISGAA